MTLPDVIKYAAGLAYRAASGVIIDAAQAFRTLVLNAKYSLPANCYDFVAYWGPRLGDDGQLHSHASHSGRHPRLTDEQARVCLAEAKGWWLTERQGPYETAEELIDTNPVVKSVVEDTRISPETLTRHMKQIAPKFHYGKLKSKPYLDEQHREVRMASCEEMLRKSDRHRQLVVFLDEKTLCLNQDKQMGWFSSDEEDYHYSTKPAKYKGKIISLKYLIAVNYLIGPVYITFYTGTAGLPANARGKSYLVGE